MKILYNKKDSALIQMADGHQSQLGKAKLGPVMEVSCSYSLGFQLMPGYLNSNVIEKPIESRGKRILRILGSFKMKNLCQTHH